MSEGLYLFIVFVFKTFSIIKNVHHSALLYLGECRGGEAHEEKNQVEIPRRGGEVGRISGWQTSIAVSRRRMLVKLSSRNLSQTSGCIY